MNTQFSATGPAALLPHAYVAQAPEGPLDPNDLNGRPARVIVPNWPDIDYPDHVFMQWQDAQGSYDDDLKIHVDWGDDEVVEFEVPLAIVMRGLGTTITVRYWVQTPSGRLDGEDWPLAIREGFVAALELDLSTRNYVVFEGKPPPQAPDFAQYQRAATWGVAPYRWRSGTERVAQVDSNGVITLLASGQSRVSAVDSLGVEQGFDLTVRGIVSLHWLSPSADWQGMQGVCTAAQLAPVTRAQLGQAWQLYYPQTGPVLDWLQWLPYPLWTGDTLGAGTALAYNLNGAPNAVGGDNDNVQSFTTDTFLPVVGAGT